ncbi:bifunctional glycosyltransferase family 2/GtrA family protein [Actinoplanes sp. TBRC 11911]|uniref:bifunctional glycosyltransferase family 2/GtrA family protein n=1 Tax=Actinoplanes sp. TBRC 11911 TaxID=2729386 RepID=UPI00145F62C9|nr:bifunctional glycosyltransferase family 2/GtrA family protein [Actinoplanes sp. TBRC 11911]NMO54900.1 bifunctional glycosyltransferase family 2/GtrA family protein [Actinoplanes sp. TBRC 11911]
MSLETLSADAPDTTPAGAPVLDVVVPVYNEERDLEPSVRRLRAYLKAHFPYPFRITVADNASTDATAQVARRLTEEFPDVRSVRLDEKGRGLALKHVWTRSDAAVLAYMDVDLSTDLGALLPLVAPLISGHSDLAIGSRLARGSRVVRGPKREFISRGYNLLLRGTLAAHFSDAQCGFKAIRAEVAARLLPMVEDPGWFFDTEMLVLAERARLRIHEVPVDWVDDSDSRVDIIPTAVADLKGIVRLARALSTGRLPLATLRDQLGRDQPAREQPGGGQLPGGGRLAGEQAVRDQAGRDPLRVAGLPAGLPRQLVRFAVVGVASTLAYLALFALLRTGMGPQWANFTALLITAIANTAANRRLTFGVRGTESAWRHQAQGLIVFGIGLGVTSGSLALLDATTVQPARLIELSVLVIANLIATAARFLLMRIWVFRPARALPAER